MDKNKLQDVAREKKLCYKCLGMGHTIWDCKFKYGCRICKKHHHTALHRVTQKERSTEKVQASTVEPRYSGFQGTGHFEPL